VIRKMGFIFMIENKSIVFFIFLINISLLLMGQILLQFKDLAVNQLPHHHQLLQMLLLQEVLVIIIHSI